VALTMEEIVVKVPPGKVRIKEAFCPRGCSLIDPRVKMSGQPAITARLRLLGESGLIHLNPYYGVFEYRSEIPLENGDVVDLFCPHCGTPLTVEQQCGMCHAHMFALQLPGGGEVRACPRIGCHNHQLTIVDLDAQFAEYYEEETRPKM